MFARRLSEAGRRSGIRMTDAELKGPADLASVWRRVGSGTAVVLNLPMVAWKRVIISPLLALLFARLRRRRSVVVVHEWADLDWRRRLVYTPYVWLADRLIFSSPLVHRQFRSAGLGRLSRGVDSVIPVPPNIQRPLRLVETPLRTELAAAREAGTWIIGHFGSIYPKKHSDMVLDVIAELRRRGHDVRGVFVGSFIKGSDNVEGEFLAKVRRLNLEQCVTITGYVDATEEIFSIFSEVDIFVYAFEEGLTSRRASVLACLQSGKPVVVNAPKDPTEFDHHEIYGQAMLRGGLQFVASGEDACLYANSIERLMANPPVGAVQDFETSWQAAIRVLVAAISDERAGSDKTRTRLQSASARE
jgi:glycosyltransferase involved in cell wall biosynthesis